MTHGSIFLCELLATCLTAKLAGAAAIVVAVVAPSFAQDLPVRSNSGYGSALERAFERPEPTDERSCAAAGGIAIVNAICFPGKACAIVDKRNVERVACLPVEAAADEPDNARVANGRRALKRRPTK